MIVKNMKNKKYYVFEMDSKKLTIISTVLLLFMMALTEVIGKGDLIFSNFPLVIMFLIPYLIFHEILHSVSYMIHGAKFKNITYGAHLEKGILCCLCKQNISRKNILISLIYPLVFIGIITYVIGIIIDNSVLVSLSIFNISGCAGDIFMFIGLSKLHNFEYSEFDNPMAFGLYSDEDLSTKKMYALNFIGVQDSLEKKDMKKIKVSKLSWIIFAIIALASVFYLYLDGINFFEE